MKRRDANLALLLGVFSLAANAQARVGKVRRIGYLSQPSRESVEPVLQMFLRALRDLGWIEGGNLAIEFRWADGNVGRLPDLAADLVRSNVELIVAPAASAALAAKNATRTIPIVMIFPADPVQLGLVASLAHPGGNVTGTTYAHGTEILRKQLQILTEVVPHASRIAVLKSDGPFATIQRGVFESAAPSMKIRLQYLEARGPGDFEAAFAAMARDRAQALVVAGSSAYLPYRNELAEFVTKGRLPTMYTLREMVLEAAGLMAYAANLSAFVGRSAAYVDKILKGANPADLPVEQPTKFELVINLRRARALGLSIPRSVLQRADEVIQ